MWLDNSKHDTKSNIQLNTAQSKKATYNIFLIIQTIT